MLPIKPGCNGNRAQQLIGLALKRFARIDDAKNLLENNRANT